MPTTGMKDPTLCMFLYHGRSRGSTSLEDWGINGPMIPFEYMITTYGNVRIKFDLGLARVLSAAGWSSELGDDGCLELAYDAECLRLGGVSYGDWDVCMRAKENVADTPDKLIAALKQAHRDMVQCDLEEEGGFDDLPLLTGSRLRNDR